MKIKRIFKFIFNKTFIQKLVAYSFLILTFFIFQDFLLIFFLTFIFAYLFYTLGEIIKIRLDLLFINIIKKDKTVLFFKKIFSINAIILILYISFIGILVFALFDLIPQLSKELRELSEYVPFLSEPITQITQKLEEIKNLNTQIGGNIENLVSQKDIDLVIDIYNRLKGPGEILFQVVLSVILSYIFISDRERLGNYLNGIKNSNFGFFYDEYKSIFSKIVKTFGLVFQAQGIIALANAALTTLGLLIIGLVNTGDQFPFIYTLAIIVFICGFIPVLGTFISSIPILIIGFSMVGGITVFLEIIALIAIIHMIEAYYLNPKIVSSFIHLPVSLTFLVLIISEHFLGFAGLVIGISSFYLILELFKDFDKIVTKTKETYNNVCELENDTKKSLKKDIRLSRKIEE